MKKMILFALVAILIGAGCTEHIDELKNESKTDQLIFNNSEIDFSSFNLPFPEGTSFQELDSKLIFTLPEPFYIVGVDKDGNYHRSASGGTGSISCIYSEGGENAPVNHNHEFSCKKKADCNSCKKIKAIEGVHNELVEIAIFNPDFDLFVDEFSHINNKMLLHHSLIKIPEVYEFLQEFEADFLPSETDQRKVAFVNMFGYILPLEIPADIDDSSLYLVSNRGESSVDVCRCNQQISCSKLRTLAVVSCGSYDRCSDCRMIGSVVNSDDEVMQFSENNGRISLK